MIEQDRRCPLPNFTEDIDIPEIGTSLEGVELIFDIDGFLTIGTADDVLGILNPPNKPLACSPTVLICTEPSQTRRILPHCKMPITRIPGNWWSNSEESCTFVKQLRGALIGKVSFQWCPGHLYLVRRKLSTNNDFWTNDELDALNRVFEQARDEVYTEADVLENTLTPTDAVALDLHQLRVRVNRCSLAVANNVMFRVAHQSNAVRLIEFLVFFRTASIRRFFDEQHIGVCVCFYGSKATLRWDTTDDWGYIRTQILSQIWPNPRVDHCFDFCVSVSARGRAVFYDEDKLNHLCSRLLARQYPLPSNITRAYRSYNMLGFMKFANRQVDLGYFFNKGGHLYGPEPHEQRSWPCEPYADPADPEGPLIEDAVSEETGFGVWSLNFYTSWQGQMRKELEDCVGALSPLAHLLGSATNTMAQHAISRQLDSLRGLVDRVSKIGTQQRSAPIRFEFSTDWATGGIVLCDIVTGISHIPDSDNDEEWGASAQVILASVGRGELPPLQQSGLHAVPMKDLTDFARKVCEWSIAAISSTVRQLQTAAYFPTCADVASFATVEDLLLNSFLFGRIGPQSDLYCQKRDNSRRDPQDIYRAGFHSRAIS